MMNLSTIIQNISTVAIFGHTNIDGDCLGSMLSLGSILEAQGVQVDYIADPVHPSRSRLPGVDKLSSDLDTSKAYDLHIAVDFSPWHRTGQLYHDHQTYFDQIKDNLLVIDHHVEDNYHATRNLKDAQTDANCVWLYELFKDAGREEHITPQVATYLYMGISTDTGNFMHDKQSERVFAASSALMSHGADKKLITFNIYRNTDHAVIGVLSEVLSSYRIQDDILITYRDETKQQPISKAQRDVILNLLNGIGGYKVLAFCVIKDDHTIKLSLRSKQAHEVQGPIVDVNELASTYFKGGGHIHASGGVYLHNQKPPQAIDEIFALIDNHIHS